MVMSKIQSILEDKQEKVIRPWGYYHLLVKTNEYLIKQIVILPKKSISLQKHKHRSEHWIVLNGEADIVIDNKIMEIDYENLIGQWHKDRNLIDGSTDKDQYMKLIQEAGELSDSLCKGKDISDDIGDILDVLINIMVRNNLTINECLSVAYSDIKDRKGKMIDGVFIKEGDK